MAKSAKRAAAMAARRDAKRRRFEAALARGPAAGKSRYALKLRRKGGHGAVAPGWQWWWERGGEVAA